jgi:hypothetical protein
MAEAAQSHLLLGLLLRMRAVAAVVVRLVLYLAFPRVVLEVLAEEALGNHL